MANNYLQFSEWLGVRDEAERIWLVAKLSCGRARGRPDVRVGVRGRPVAGQGHLAAC